jgi:hypothetical protein
MHTGAPAVALENLGQAARAGRYIALAQSSGASKDTETVRRHADIWKS